MLVTLAQAVIGSDDLAAGLQVFTGAVPAEVARRLVAGEGAPGAGTPAAMFGPSLAEACGGEYLGAATEPRPTS